MKKIFLINIFIIIISMLCNVVYATDNDIDFSNLPISFDLRDKINIRVENQGNRGWCAAYSMTKVIETNLLLTRGIDYNLSEAYLAYSEAPYFGGATEWKTDIVTARALVQDVLVSKYVLEDDVPNKDYEFNELNLIKFEKAKNMIKDYEVEIFESDNTVEDIKKHIMSNGGVYLSVDASSKWCNSSTGAIYSNVKRSDKYEELNTREEVLKYTDDTANHSVVIIGWNDNYSRNNFNSNCRPEKDGAWLVLNSWGTNWGNNGTGWVSYEDMNFLNIAKFGIKEVKIYGELVAKFTYEYNKLSNTVIAKITADEKIESIEGWNQYSEDTYNKNFTEPFEPYNIELKSKIDGSVATIEINIPSNIFEEQSVEDEKRKIETEQRKKELEELKYEKQRKDTFLNNLNIIIYIGIGVLILLIVIFIFNFKKSKESQN